MSFFTHQGPAVHAQHVKRGVAVARAIFLSIALCLICPVLAAIALLAAGVGK